jgi:hypothetical protein
MYMYPILLFCSHSLENQRSVHMCGDSGAIRRSRISITDPGKVDRVKVEVIGELEAFVYRGLYH